VIAQAISAPPEHVLYWGRRRTRHIILTKDDKTMAKGKSTGGSHRSAISGRYVTAKHGKASPHTTVSETRGGGSTGSHRSAVSGKFVSAGYSKSHPRTTVKES